MADENYTIVSVADKKELVELTKYLGERGYHWDGGISLNCVKDGIQRFEHRDSARYINDFAVRICNPGGHKVLNFCSTQWYKDNYSNSRFTTVRDFVPGYFVQDVIELVESLDDKIAAMEQRQKGGK